MSAPTPGPWRWMNDDTLVADHGRRRVIVTGGNCGALQTCGSNGLLRHHSAEDENARLIAAAPDLLAVVRALSEFQRTYETNTQSPGWMPGNEFYSNLLMVIVRDARAALKKAEGAA
jgi:hypothetical protein